MWILTKETPDTNSGTPDERKLRSVNFWYVLLLSFIIVWMCGAYLYLYTKTENSASPPIVLIEGGGVDLNSISNLFSVNAPPVSTNDLKGAKPLFVTKEDYSIGEVVIVKYFYVEAVVIDKSIPNGSAYTLLYKDHNHTLRTIKLSKTLIMAPADTGSLNPVSLLVD